MNWFLGLFSIGIGDLFDRYPTVYSMAFLQLYNHRVEGTQSATAPTKGAAAPNMASSAPSA
ncbi:hypothetical protein [Streptomyces sp. MBT62]|uniref:hypothetical protein n=1 Tax=Streptomyces sp. MBT62 TaxID=2800410 RepID=UPI00190AE19B|nr:hypothetical protein [Streptomyces sp. MBT62]MBK3571428.1 hypothetical protein [Streptomyces sp. MBT62]